jgi:hypothetical protein
VSLAVEKHLGHQDGELGFTGAGRAFKNDVRVQERCKDIKNHFAVYCQAFLNLLYPVLEVGFQERNVLEILRERVVLIEVFRRGNEILAFEIKFIEYPVRHQ